MNIKSNRLYRVVRVVHTSKPHWWSIEVAFKRWFGLTRTDWRPTHEVCHSEEDALHRTLDFISMWGGELI